MGKVSPTWLDRWTFCIQLNIGFSSQNWSETKLHRVLAPTSIYTGTPTITKGPRRVRLWYKLCSWVTALNYCTLCIDSVWCPAYCVINTLYFTVHSPQSTFFIWHFHFRTLQCALPTVTVNIVSCIIHVVHHIPKTEHCSMHCNDIHIYSFTLSLQTEMFPMS